MVEILGEESFVELDGFKLFTKSFGVNRGYPTVVMDSGYGDYSKAWKAVIPDIASITKVFVYDRAGLGRSEKSPNPRTSKEIINELKHLLLKSNITPPYILVGHSFGGVNVRLYASEFPNDVVGVLLVDATPEEYRERFLPSMPREFQEAYNKQFIHESTFDEFMESLGQLKLKRHLGNIPLIIISAGKKDHYSPSSQELWHEMQRETLSISENSEFIIAYNSAHYIQNYEPSIIIDGIKRLLLKI
ncbi:alpha/beta fold hydrolase [Paenibacillus solisilvae]|uniref:Alpha/beta fold hydrolase n=1 Tax=Paenibacillus solisilvae TaxID=2486751 RepID=A0ABW0VYW3_9BACL